jgi:hypothetical protein
MMTQEADDDIILPDRFQNTINIHMNHSGIFRIGLLKKIGKMKTIFCHDQLFRIPKYYSKNGSKKLRGIETITIGVLTPKNAEFASLTEFGHHDFLLELNMLRHPIFKY